MKNNLTIFKSLIISIPIFIFACQARPIITSDSIVGDWKGESQWLCENDDLIWSTTIEFKPDGSFTAIMDIPASNAPLPNSLGSGTWSLSESNIEIKFSTTTWTGEVSDNKMEGSLADDGTSCTGKWSLNKQ